MFPTNNDFESEFTFGHTGTPLSEEPPFHILLLGNWSGNTDKTSLENRNVVVVDRDNYDEVLQKSNVKLDLDLIGDGAEKIHIQFAELDDFHPDNIFRNISVFSDLREIRRRLSDPDTFERAAQEVRSWSDSSIETFATDVDVQSQLEDAPPIESDNLLDMILTRPNSPAISLKPQNTDNSELGKLVSKLVSPYLVKIDENEQSKLIQIVDEAISQIMRAILHHPDFQALESAWRGLYFLVRRVETNLDLKVFILDISQHELSHNLKSINDLTDSFLFSKLSSSFALIGGNYSFGLNVNDIACLMRLSKLVKNIDAPFVSFIRPEMFGRECFSLEVSDSDSTVSPESTETKLWDALRASEESDYIGLSPMRIISRMPYGETSEPTEVFSFEEFVDENYSGKILWMNPCFVITLALAQNFLRYSWDLTKFQLQDIPKLPLIFLDDEDSASNIPCAETFLTEKWAERILENGLIPILSPRNSDYVRILRLQSISSDSTKLNGKW